MTAQKSAPSQARPRAHEPRREPIVNQPTRPIRATTRSDASTPIALATTALTAAARTMYGLDGTSIDAAVDAAWTPTGPDKDTLRASITRLRQPAAVEAAA